MRTGADYKESLRDGRNVLGSGEGAVDDVTTHPATAAMANEYVAWYDRHFDPDWAGYPADSARREGPKAPAGVDPAEVVR